MCNFFVSNHFAAINRASEPQLEEWFGGVFHLWQTVKLFLLSIQIYINCNIYSLDFLFHDTGIFEGAVKWRLQRKMYYPVPHSQDFFERGKSNTDFAVFKTFGVSLFLVVVTSWCFQEWRQKMKFSQHLHLNLPWSPLLSQWAVGFGGFEFFWLCFCVCVVLCWGLFGVFCLFCFVFVFLLFPASV